MSSKWLDFILEHPDIKWDYRDISANPNIWWNDVEKNPSFPWNWYYLTQNPSISWKIIIENLDKPWDFSGVSQHPDLDIAFVLANPQFPWDWSEISKHDKITWEIVKANKHWNHPDKTKRIVPWKFSALSRNKNITLDIVEKNPKYQWSFPNLSRNPNLTWEFIEKHLDKGWDWILLAERKIVTWDIVKKHPKIFQNHSVISSLCTNPNITWEIMKNDINGDRIIPWDSTSISANPNITIDIVKANQWVKWNMFTLSSNPNFSWKIINENPDIFPSHYRGCFHPRMLNIEEFTWEDWLHLSQRDKVDMYPMMYRCPNINWTILQSCRMVAVKSPVSDFDFKWDYYLFCRNPMNEPVRKRIQARCRLLEEELIKEVMKPERIQRRIEKYGIHRANSCFCCRHHS